MRRDKVPPSLLTQFIALVVYFALAFSIKSNVGRYQAMGHIDMNGQTCLLLNVSVVIGVIGGVGADGRTGRSLVNLHSRNLGANADMISDLQAGPKDGEEMVIRLWKTRRMAI